MKFILIAAATLIGSMIALHTSFQNGSLIRYLDAHPHPTLVPKAHYYIGASLYLLGNLQESATHYLRIAERYPQSSYAEESYFNYLNDLDAMNTPRLQMASLYETYLEKFPNGGYKEIVQRRIEFCRNSR
jgi:outer membrane protein assembly factor BamD (BamD/ComL family)